MKLTIAIIALTVLFACAVSAVAAGYDQTTGDGLAGSSSSNPADAPISALEEGPHSDTNAEEKGAVPEMTQAEKQMRAEDNFQKRLVGLKEVISELEDRLRAIRAETTAPSQDDMDRISHDASLADSELRTMSTIGLSPWRRSSGQSSPTGCLT